MRELNPYERMQQERLEDEKRNRARTQEGRLARYALVRISERRYAIVEEQSVSMWDDDHVPVREFRYVEGCKSMSFWDVRKKMLELRRAEIAEKKE
jgi:hypothetical protein